ncbi:hypothetical protein CFC21_105428 [Triticum aestivum]|uniref:Speckle-type POZ protein n=4 Tax=Poaceae TaxID=4479 RepID=B6SGI6_MAIZE|nr:BTB/POZ and MATH domain-containing protein 2-like [Triticum dicoccoides]XP_044431492.1 BTB/POZ and MATH domain-containing protein 2-like [Triticum aestivum]ACG23969.1 speckle-type POZ protein [Zea mays]KAF7104536.1 hypothetical protein CFC21_105428 [Triticum aestivum]VAI93050.1 unnamed protein product [Triticum turgidum subsp. durum]
MAASESSLTRTASTCAPETAHGSHVFKIDGYSLHRGFGVGKFIRSATFAVGGYDWCVRFYPDGDREDSNGWVSAYLELKTENTEVRVLYDIWLVDQATAAPPPRPYARPNPSQVDPSIFDTRDNAAVSWGFTKFRRKSELGEWIVDDILGIQCNLTVIKFKEAQVEDAKTNVVVQVPPSDLFDNLSSLLEATEGADVSFNVKHAVFSAHKIILAMRSAVFRAEFYGPMRDKKRHNITVEDMQPAAFRGLLHFIYKDSLPPMDDLNDEEYEEMLRHLLVAADRYAMERMKLMCESKLCEVLCAETVATTLALADQHHCSQLKDACIEFMNSSNIIGDVVASKGYEQLKRECPSIIADIWEKAAKSRRI